MCSDNYSVFFLWIKLALFFFFFEVNLCHIPFMMNKTYLNVEHSTLSPHCFSNISDWWRPCDTVCISRQQTTMRFFQASSFCGCTDLRTGGLIIGYFTLLCEIANITIIGQHWMYSGMLKIAFSFLFFERFVGLVEFFIFSSRFGGNHSIALWHSSCKLAWIGT